MHRPLCLVLLLAAAPASAQTEDFSKSITVADGTAFGCSQQLTAKLAGGGGITASGNGAAALNCPAAADAGIIHSSKALAGEWLVTVEVSNLQYQKGVGEEGENGVTLAAIVSDVPSPGASAGWKGRRIVGVEVDNLGATGAGDNTVFVNYWSSAGETYSLAGGQWTTEWSPAFTYQPTGRYKITIEKNKTDYVIKVDGPGATVNASIAIASVQGATSEYLAVGDRLTDFFSGSMDVNSITLPGSCSSTRDGVNIEPKNKDGIRYYDTKKGAGRPPASSCDCQLSSVNDGLGAALPVLLVLAFFLLRRRPQIR